MKKEYKKPVISVEMFTISQSIAHNCGANLDWGNATLKYKGECGWDPDGRDQGAEIVLFMDYPACNLLTEQFEGVCYNNPEGGLNVFNS